MRSYLTNRKQQVRVNEQLSDFLNIGSGVPQGSILGPLLFLIYLNDLTECLINDDAYLFADDLKTIETTLFGMQILLSKLENWCLLNSMSVNLDKTHILSFKSSFHGCTLAGRGVEPNCVETDLGVVDKNLTWHENVSLRLANPTKCFFLLKRNLPFCASTEKKLNVYCGMVVPKLSYASQVWYASKNRLQSNRSVTKEPPGGFYRQKKIMLLDYLF